MARKSKKTRRSCASTLLIFGVVIALLACVVYAVWAQTLDIKGVEQMEERSAVYDMDGKYYSRLKGENRVIVGLQDVSPSFIKALLAREDTRFYKHHGVDPIGIARAVVRNIVHFHVREGASTLTQQLARNSFPLGGKNLHRKMLEAFVALRIERNYTKKQILEYYVNRIYFGPGFYGIETASQIYFNKHAPDLSLGESAMLAGLIRGPTKFSPFKNMKGALAQRDTVLDRMVELKMISKAQAESGKHAKLNIAKRRTALTQENYAMDAVMRDLDLVLTDDQVGEGGLKIYTTIDPQLQKAAQSALDGELRKIEQRPGWSHPKRSDYTVEMRDARQPTNYLQGAVMVVDNRDGGIRAIVGGRDFAESNFNRALLSPRQVGSTFKPFVYATAFARGALQPGTLVDDSPIRAGELRGAAGWSPANSDGTYRGMLPAEDGLILSRNTMSARVGDMAGIDAVQRTALAVGIGKIPHLPSIFLGSFETTLKELTTAYTVFPNGGVHQLAYIIERIDNSDGEVIYLANHSAPAALPPGVCGEITGILQKVLDHGTAAAARSSLGFNKPAAGKTGTTNDYRDAWFVGYTKSLTCGVWVGLDQPETIMAHGYGSALALPVWVDVMNAASGQRYPATALPVFEGATQPAVDGRRENPAPGQNFFRSLKRFFGGH